MKVEEQETAPVQGNEVANVNLSVDQEGEEESRSEEELAKERRNNCLKRIIVALILVGFVVFVVIDSLTTGHVRMGIQRFLEWIEMNPGPGFFVFVVVYFIATVLFVPGSILTLGAGFVFGNALSLGVGILLGTLSVFIGASAGAVVAFLLGRYLLRSRVAGLTKRYAIFEAVDSALEDKGFRIMALLRLSPIIPFNAINYIAGVTAISLRDYCLALLAIIPGTTVFVFLGASAGSLADSANSGENSTVTIVVVVVGVVMGLAAVFLTSYYAKKELNRVLAARQGVEATITGETSDVESGEDEENSGANAESAQFNENSRAGDEPDAVPYSAAEIYEDSASETSEFSA